MCSSTHSSNLYGKVIRTDMLLYGIKSRECSLFVDGQLVFNKSTKIIQRNLKFEKTFLQRRYPDSQYMYH